MFNIRKLFCQNSNCVIQRNQFVFEKINSLCGSMKQHWKILMTVCKYNIRNLNVLFTDSPDHTRTNFWERFLLQKLMKILFVGNYEVFIPQRQEASIGISIAWNNLKILQAYTYWWEPNFLLHTYGRIWIYLANISMIVSHQKNYFNF